MAHPYTLVATWSDTVAMPDTGDWGDAAEQNIPDEGIGDNTKYIKTQIEALPTIVRGVYNHGTMDSYNTPGSETWGILQTPFGTYSTTRTTWPTGGGLSDSLQLDYQTGSPATFITETNDICVIDCSFIAYMEPGASPYAGTFRLCTLADGGSFAPDEVPGTLTVVTCPGSGVTPTYAIGVHLRGVWLPGEVGTFDIVLQAISSSGVAVAIYSPIVWTVEQHRLIGSL